jgi:microcystin-dependent protein
MELDSLLAEPIDAPLPLGMVIAYAGPLDESSRRILANSGWLVCEGQRISRTSYPSLYRVIGDIHGRGDAVSTFNLPDYRGRFLRGVDNGVGRDPDAGGRQPAAAGGLVGDAVGSVQADEFRRHDHRTIQMIGDNAVDGVDSATTHSGEHHNEARQTSADGGNETRPKNANVFWLILAGKALA